MSEGFLGCRAMNFYVGDSGIVRLDSDYSTQESNIVHINSLEIFLLQGESIEAVNLSSNEYRLENLLSLPVRSLGVRHSR